MLKFSYTLSITECIPLLAFGYTSISGPYQAKYRYEMLYSFSFPALVFRKVIMIFSFLSGAILTYSPAQKTLTTEVLDLRRTVILFPVHCISHLEY